MTDFEDAFDRVFGQLKDKYDGRHDRVSDEDLDKQKTAPGESSMRVSTNTGSSLVPVRARTVKPAAGGRGARKEAEQEQMRQWRIVQTTIRTGIAMDSVAATTVHAYHRADDLQAAIADTYFGVRRHEAMNEMMKMMAEECLRRGDAALLSILESHPKRLAEEL